MATVAELQSAASAAATATLAQANTFLEALTNAANVEFSNGFNIDELLPDSYNYASVPEVNFPVVAGGLRPTLSGLDVGGAPEAPAVSIMAPGDIALPADDLLAPTNQFTYFEAAYASVLLDPLKAKLLEDLTNGGYGIDVADEAALFQRARDREAEATMTRISAAGRTMAARGFPLPPGELAVTIDRAYQEFQNKASDVSRDIFTNSAARFVENRKFTIEQVKELEQILIGFHNSVQERALNVAKATAEVALAVYNALVLRYRTRLEAAKIASDVQRDKLQAEAERARAVVDIFRGQLSAYEANLRRAVDTARMQVDLYSADIAANRNLTDGLIARASLQQKVLEATVQQNIQISALAVENAKAKLLATVQGLQFQTEAVKFGAEKFFATLTAMYGSINSLSVQSATE